MPRGHSIGVSTELLLLTIFTMAFGFFKKKMQPEKQSSSHYRELVVKEVILETLDAVSLVFEQPEPKLNYQAGQFLTLILVVGGKEVRRAYSLSSSPVTDVLPAITVKRVKDGIVSNHIADQIKAGDKIRIMDPAGHFTVDFNASSQKNLILFAGGSGITPILSLIKTLLSTEPKSSCSLIYSNRNEKSIIFRKKLDELFSKHSDRFSIFYLLDDASSGWSGYKGFLNNQILTEIFNKISATNTDQTYYMMCGPEGMMKNVETLLSERGIGPDKLKHESFNHAAGEKKVTAEPAGQRSHTVVIRYDGHEHSVVVEPGKTILETALEKGIDLPYSCQSGLCTACRGKALSGKVKLDEEDGLSQSEIEEGYVLTCVGHPLTDDVVIEIG